MDKGDVVPAPDASPGCSRRRSLQPLNGHCGKSLRYTLPFVCSWRAATDTIGTRVSLGKVQPMFEWLLESDCLRLSMAG